MIEILGLIITAIGVLVAWLAYRYQRDSKTQPSPELPVLDSLFLKIRQTKQIRVGFIRYAPLIDYDEIDGKVIPKGLYAVLMNKVAEEFGYRVSYIPMNMGDVVPHVEFGKVDFALSVFETPKRSRRVDFAALLHSVKVGGVALASQSKVKSVADLQRKDVRIAVCKGEIGHEWARGILNIPKNRLDIIDTSDIWRIAALVESNQADIALADLISCYRFSQERKKKVPAIRLMFRRNPITVCPNGCMVACEQEELAEWLEKEFRRVRDYPEIRNLEEKTIAELPGILHRL